MANVDRRWVCAAPIKDHSLVFLLLIKVSLFFLYDISIQTCGYLKTFSLHLNALIFLIRDLQYAKHIRLLKQSVTNGSYTYWSILSNLTKPIKPEANLYELQFNWYVVVI